ncbi:MAG: flagellar motor switch protein FliG [Boseongicola sp.]|nr:MAG: flagellar motor switch protein FliG [Boseongicola sp.]
MSLDLALPDIPALGAALPVVNLSGREKAAIVVRLLLQSGTVPALSELPESLQTELAVQLARMTPVNQDTVRAVASEFSEQIERIGLSFPTGIDGALDLLDGVISASASSRVRRMSSGDFNGDPWETLDAVENERLAPILENESLEVAALVLSKLKVSKAADLLSHLPGELARRITYAVSLTGSVAPEVVRRIGVSLAEQLDTRPARAFSDGPVTRVGAILNYSPASVRDDVLTGLDNEDAEFAEQVRKAIFTFANIPERVSPRDVARIHRDLEQADLITVIAATEGDDAKTVEFLLEHISQRMAENLRSEGSEKKGTTVKDCEESMRRIVNAVHKLEGEGEIFLTANDA